MGTPLRIIDGSKIASFDGLILEVTGLSGKSDSKRLAINNIDSVAVAPAGEEWMFIVKSRSAGCSIIISEAKKADWENLVREVRKAQNEFQVPQGS